jgi:competence protein ComEC
MFSWVPFAMVRIALYLTGGILLAIYRPGLISEQVTFYILFALICVYLISVFILRVWRWVKVFNGLIGLSGIFFFGYLHLLSSTSSRQGDHLLNERDEVVAYEAIVRSAPESKAKSWKLQVEVLRVKTEDWKVRSGHVMLYVSKKSLEKIPWVYGDRLLIKGTPNQLQPPANPNEFDFKRFLSFRNIYHQQFVLSDQIRFIDHAERKGFIYYSHRVRAWATDVIRKNIPGQQEQSIAMALVLGVTEGIDTDLQSAYAASGAMHVLAVSGLHVGIIYGIILVLLRPLNRYSWSRWVVAGISILLLWSFAFVTGLSPSVLRAVTMFSFIALARPLGWHSNIYNTLAASAFVLLIYNPYLIMSVGFQLSYLAVIGIVYLQRPIYNLLEIDNRVGDWVWQITCVSIAAQIATFSLGMLYFHQFPVYFLVSNLFVIPLSTLVLISGIVLLVVSGWSALAGIIGAGLQQLIKLLNWLVFKTEEMPFSLISDIYLSTFQCWVLIGGLCALTFMIQYRSVKWMYAAFFVAIVFVGTQYLHLHQWVNREQFVVYSVSGYSALEWINHGVSYFKADSTLQADQERMRFHIRPNRLKRGVSLVNTKIPFSKILPQGIEAVYWKDNRILLAQNKEAQLPQLAEIDYLVVARNAVAPEALNGLSAKKIILDGSNSRSYVNRLKKVIDKDRLHVVLEDGAFVLSQ